MPRRAAQAAIPGEAEEQAAAAVLTVEPEAVELPPSPAALAADKDFAHLTSAEVVQMLRDGRASLNGRPGVLCKDGWLCDPLYS